MSWWFMRSDAYHSMVLWKSIILIKFVFIISARKIQLEQINSCQVKVNSAVINLESLAQEDGKPRYTAEYGGWTYTFNPCTSYNLPEDPHEGLGDQCHYVSLCKWQETDKGIEYYTLGIQRRARFNARKSWATDKLYHKSNLEDDNDLSSESVSLEGANSTASGMNSSLSSSSSSDEHNNGSSSSSSSSSEQEVEEGKGKGMKQLKKDGDEELKDKERQKREAFNKRNIGDQKKKDEDDEEEEEDSEDEEDDDVNKVDTDINVLLKFKGIRTQKSQRSLIYLICDRKRATVEDSLFLIREQHNNDIIFELHHRCCCPHLCDESFIGRDANKNITGDMGVQELKLNEPEVAKPKYMWLIVVVNGAIILAAILIATTFCRKGGSEPYNMLPVALNSSRFTLNSMESVKEPRPRSMKPVLPLPLPKADYREYTSVLLHRKQSLPQLTNVVISSKEIDIGHRLGGGLFGDTYRAIWNEYQVAAKRLTVGMHHHQISEKEYDYMIQETFFLSRQRHRNVVGMIGICVDMKQPHIINEYVDGESLKDLLIKEGEKISFTKRVKLLQQATEGMVFLHGVKKRAVLHRDLRAANILINSQDRVKVADFGVIRLTQKLRKCSEQVECSCPKHNIASGLPASVRWTAPEILECPQAIEGRKSPVSTACDIFSFAMVLWEVATFQDPFHDTASEHEVKEIILLGERPRMDNLDILPHYRELMRMCWEQEPENRPSFKQISSHLKNVQSNATKYSGKSEKQGGKNSDSATTSYLRSAFNIA